MGQKVNPIGLRLGINRTWDSRWYANDENYAGLLHEARVGRAPRTGKGHAVLASYASRSRLPRFGKISEVVESLFLAVCHALRLLRTQRLPDVPRR